MDDKKKDLCLYRLENARETLGVAKLCYDYGHYKDTVNRCYYAAFYAVKAVLALAEIDFKRHKDVVSYFNKNYVAKDIFPRDLGKKLGRLKRKREDNDYANKIVYHPEGLPHKCGSPLRLVYPRHCQFRRVRFIRSSSCCCFRRSRIRRRIRSRTG